MAKFNPFRRFRQNQTAAFAILAVMAMVSFIIIPIVMQLMDWGSRGSKQVVARCYKFGDVTLPQLDRLRNHRSALGRFYIVLHQNLKASAAAMQQTQQRSPFPMLAELATIFQQPQDDEDLVDRWLLSQHGGALGMRIDERAIREHLISLTTGATNATAAFQQTLRDIGLTRRQVDALIADFLLATQVQSLCQHNVFPLTPSLRWNALERLQRKVRVEAAAVNTAQFVSDVPEPKDDELLTFFEANRYRLPNPGRAESGFAVPTKLAFAYVTAAINDAMLAAVSADDVQRYYDDNKATLFRRPVKPTTPPSESILRDNPLTFPTLPIFPTLTPPPSPAPEPITEPTPEPVSEPAEPETAPEPESMPEGVEYVPVVFAQDDEPEIVEPVAVEPSEPINSESVDLSILFLPLEEVEARIRRTLVRERIEAQLAKIESAMRDYLEDYTRRGNAATPLDLAALAAAEGLTYTATPGAVTLFETRALDIGSDANTRFALEQHFMRPPVHFEPLRLSSADATYLLWVTESESVRYPEFAEVREQVLARFKEVNARNRARAKAKELADWASKKGGDSTLRDAFAEMPEVTVAESELFTWKSFGDNPYLAMQVVMEGGAPHEGEVCEMGVAIGEAANRNRVIKFPGDEWMAAAYSLPIGGIGVAMNAPQNVAYIIRVVETVPAIDEFVPKLRGGMPWDFDNSLYRAEFRQTYQRFVASLRREAGFEWVIPEHTRRRVSRDEE